MKKIFALLVAISAFVFIGCSDANDKPVGTVEDGDFVSEDFSIDIPRDWEVVEQFPGDIESGVLLGIVNNVRNEGFTANVNVTYVVTEQEPDIKEYGENLISSYRDTVEEFSLVSSTPVQIDVSGTPRESVLNIFEGKLRPELDALRIIQTYGYKGNRVYAITGMYSINDDQFAKEKVDATVKSFRIK